MRGRPAGVHGLWGPGEIVPVSEFRLLLPGIHSQRGIEVPENHPLTKRLRARLLEGLDEPPGRLIVDEVWLAAVEATLPSGARLPTARQIAISLGVSPRTVEMHRARIFRKLGVTNLSQALLRARDAGIIH